MKSILITLIALGMSAMTGQSATDGWTAFHKLTGTDVSMTLTNTHYANGTAYDYSIVDGPAANDTITIKGKLHAKLSGVGSKIGDYVAGGGGGSGGGGGGKLHGPMGGEVTGITVIFTNPNTGNSSNVFIHDPYNNAVINYVWDRGIYTYLPPHTTWSTSYWAPLPSSNGILASSWWKPLWMRDEG